MRDSSSNFVVWRTYCSITHTPPSDRSMLLSLPGSRTQRTRRERGRRWAATIHPAGSRSSCCLIGSRFLDPHSSSASLPRLRPEQAGVPDVLDGEHADELSILGNG